MQKYIGVRLPIDFMLQSCNNRLRKRGNMTRTYTKNKVLSYLVDCKGYSEDEANEYISNGSYVELMSDSDWESIKEFSK